MIIYKMSNAILSENDNCYESFIVTEENGDIMKTYVCKRILNNTHNGINEIYSRLDRTATMGKFKPTANILVMKKRFYNKTYWVLTYNDERKRYYSTAVSTTTYLKNHRYN